MRKKVYTDEMIIALIELRDQNLSWQDVAIEFNTMFATNKSKDTLRKQYDLYRDYNFSQEELLDNIKTRYSSRKRSSTLSKENKLLWEQIHFNDEVLERIGEVVKDVKIPKLPTTKLPAKSKKKTNMALELLLSDIHIGIKTKTTDTISTRKRIEKISEVVLEEIERKSKSYNIEKLVLLLNGDLIQGNNLHHDSSASCETSDSEQVADAIRILFYSLIYPLSKTGLQIEVIGMCGNHDRQSKDRPIVKPGRYYLTWIIYNTLEMLCTQTGLKNVKWTVPEDEYHAYEIFGCWFVVEHGHAKGCSPNRSSLESQLMKRQNQTGKILKGIRICHYHEPLISGTGRHLVNGSTVTDDHFGSSLGFKSLPCQLLSFYVETKVRETSYYYTFPINLEEVV